MKQISLLLALMWLVGCASPNATPISPLLPTSPPSGELPALDPAEIELGESVYAVHCASCHGADLEGQLDWKNPNEDGSFRSPPHDETGHTWHHSDAILLEAIGKGGTRLGGTMAGKSNMPAYSQILTDEEISAVLTFIKSSWSADIQQVQWEQNQR